MQQPLNRLNKFLVWLVVRHELKGFPGIFFPVQILVFCCCHIIFVFVDHYLDLDVGHLIRMHLLFSHLTVRQAWSSDWSIPSIAFIEVHNILRNVCYRRTKVFFLWSFREAMQELLLQGGSWFGRIWKGTEFRLSGGDVWVAVVGWRCEDSDDWWLDSIVLTFGVFNKMELEPFMVTYASHLKMLFRKFTHK